MEVGVFIPQGLLHEYPNRDSGAAWARSLALAQQAEGLGFESLWVADHFHSIPTPTEELAFESFLLLTAIAGVTKRVNLGHLVLCAGFRNPALTAKMFGTLGAAAGGRVEVGLGAGWKEDEWRAYGYGWPSLSDRFDALDDAAHIIKIMLATPTGTHDGKRTSVGPAINLPGLHPARLIVGGNGRKRTWPIAARLADELNMNFIPPQDLPEARAALDAVCTTQNRDPASLRVSVHLGRDDVANAGQARVDFLAAYREQGIDRVMCSLPRCAVDDEVFAQFRDDCRAAGLHLADSPLEAPGAPASLVHAKK